LDANIPEGTPIMVPERFGHLLYAETDGRYPIWNVPYVKLDYRPGESPQLAMIGEKYQESYNDVNKLNESDVWAVVWAKIANPGFYRGFSDAAFIEALRVSGSEYVILFEPELFLFMSIHPGLREIDGPARVWVFEVDHEALGQADRTPLFTNQRTLGLLSRESGIPPQEIANSLNPFGTIAD
jgi:hypothetical protein